MILSKLEWHKRFTESELGLIYTLAKQHVELEIWLDRFRISDYVDLKDSTTVYGVGQLAAMGLIPHERVAEILYIPEDVQPVETHGLFTATNRIKIGDSVLKCHVSEDGTILLEDGRWTNMNVLAIIGAVILEV